MAQLAMIGRGLKAAGQIQEGRVAEAEGKSAQNIMNYNAQVAKREAQAIKQKTSFEQRRQAQAAARGVSSLQAALSASGARSDVGTAELLKSEQTKEYTLENLLIGYEGAIEAQRMESQAELDVMQGKIYKERGRQAKKASYLKAAGTLLTGFEATRTPQEPMQTMTSRNVRSPYSLQGRRYGGSYTRYNW